MNASIIIPVYGSIGYLFRCLLSLQANTGSHELILVDNGTGYPIPALNMAPAVIRNQKNKGFAHACNQGAKAAKGDILIFLNVDTEVHPNWLPNLLKAFDKPDVGMAGARLLFPDGTIQHSGIAFKLIQGKLNAYNLKNDTEAGYVSAVTGACMAVRANVFHDIHGFDESFYNGYDDVDLCLRIREKGWRIWYEPSAVVTHMESATGPERWVKVSENVLLLQVKWGKSDIPWKAP